MAGSGTAHLRTTGETLLRAENLVVEFPVGRTGLKVHAVSDVSIDVREGETLGLVGESGCGKSTTGRALMQLPRPTAGDVVYNGTDLTELSGQDLRRVRPEMQMIFQDPISSLNPRRRVGRIVGEPLRIWASEHQPPVSTIKVGMRALTAGAIVQAGFWALLALFWLINTGLKSLMAWDLVLLPDFDNWLRASSALLVLGALVFAPLLAALAPNVRDRVPAARLVLLGATAAEVIVFAIAFASDGLNNAGTLSFAAGAVATVLATVMVWLMPPSIADFKKMVDVRAEHEAKVNEVLEAVGIDPEAAVNRRPHEFSGGQCQRICIARSLVLDPKLIICDEPVSALDVSVQAQILNLLEDMKQRYGLTLVFIAHDLAVVKNVSDRVAVMYLGKLCEVAPPDDLYAKPAHPYTAALLGAIPVPDPTYKPDTDSALAGEIPSPVAPPSGCRFRTRCPKAEDMCAQVEPKMRQIGLGHHVACHFPIELTEKRKTPVKLAQGQRS
jgi:oligopeptide/dipeptide ABC transporter ATP-binding protein